jgi:hypothetical protein
MKHRARIGAIVLAAIVVSLAAQQTYANHPGFAPCPTEVPPSSSPPTGVVVLSVLSIKPNSDLEGDDDNIPFYDNHADIYGQVTIGDETFDLPQVSENDYPHWYSNGIFRKTVSAGGSVHISIRIKESDGGLTGDDDPVDISPPSGKDNLDLDYDLCSLRISGDFGSIEPGDSFGQTQNVVTVSGGSGSEDATIRFKIEMEDGRPVTTDDLALVDVDLIQSVSHQANLVADKPAIMRVRVASNYTSAVSTSLHVVILGGISVDRTFPIDIDPGAVKLFDLFTDSPIVFPPDGAPYVPLVRVEVVDPNAAPPGDCRHDNDQLVSGDVIPKPSLAQSGIGTEVLWQVVRSPTLNLLWAPVGTLLDIANCASDADVEEIRDLGSAFIEATYPVASIENSTSPLCINAPRSAAIDFLVTILAGFGVPFDSLLPFVLVYDLSDMAGLILPLAECDRLMGVLPNNWFDRFIYGWWENVNGLSLGEFAPHAAIFEASQNGHSHMTAPAHELGHTYGLSVAPEMKSWVCDQDFPGDIDVLACGAFGGFDEYKIVSPIAGMDEGKPSNGFWIPRGDEPAAIPASIYGEQCDSHCLMGGSSADAQDFWAGRKKWIDPADYDHLLEKLAGGPLLGAPRNAPSAVPGEVVFVSGMIAWDDRMYLGNWYRASGVEPDRVASDGLYAFRFVDASGQMLAQVGLPINWNTPDIQGGIPITFFGLYMPYAPGTDHIEIWNTKSVRLLGTRAVSANVPQVQITTPSPGEVIDGGCSFAIAWQASDADTEPLTFTVLLKPALGKAWPVAHQLSDNRYRLNTRDLTPGAYEVTVLASDGVNVGKSAPVGFTLRAGTVVDTTPPTLEVSLNREALWPPNHQMFDISATVTVRDDCDATPTFVLTSITSNEPGHGRGSGHTLDDIQGASFGTPDVEFQLRAERSGGGQGRIYTITYTARDAAGNTATAVVSVIVTHDNVGAALAANGFLRNGSGLEPRASTYSLVIPGRDPTSRIEPSRSRVSTHAGAIRPLAWRFLDVDLDRAPELVLEFPAEPTRQLVRALQSGETVGMRWVDTQGNGCVVSDIFGLGVPILLSDRSAPRNVRLAQDQAVPSVTTLRSIEPNPFNPSGIVSFDLATESKTRIQIFDLHGSLVRTLVDRQLPVGRHQVAWNGKDEHGRPVASGVYFYRLVTPDVTQSRKAVLVR